MVTSREWRQQNGDFSFLVSTDVSLLSHEFIQKAFDSFELHWAQPIASEEDLKTMLQNSCTLGLYRAVRLDESSPEDLIQVGMARFITDYVTFAYLTDVYVLPELQGRSLGKWLVSCCKDVYESMPHLRRMVLLTSATGKGGKFYERELGMQNANEGAKDLIVMTTVKKNDAGGHA